MNVDEIRSHVALDMLLFWKPEILHTYPSVELFLISNYDAVFEGSVLLSDVLNALGDDVYMSTDGFLFLYG